MATAFEKSIIDQVVISITTAVLNCQGDPRGCIRYIQNIRQTINSEQIGHTIYVKTFISGVCDLFIQTLCHTFNIPPNTV